jgi:hypothetical protein
VHPEQGSASFATVTAQQLLFLVLRYGTLAPAALSRSDSCSKLLLLLSGAATAPSTVLLGTALAAIAALLVACSCQLPFYVIPMSSGAPAALLTGGITP